MWICTILIISAGSDDLITLLIKFLAYFNLPFNSALLTMGKRKVAPQRIVSAPKGGSAAFLPVLQIIASCQVCQRTPKAQVKHSIQGIPGGPVAKKPHFHRVRQIWDPGRGTEILHVAKIIIQGLPGGPLG